jgi:O-antigen/teichoic acid export membrane protein
MAKLGRIGSLATDTMVYGVFNIVGRFLTFLLTPLYSNYLTMTENGDIASIFAIIAFFNVIYTLGMESAYFRFTDTNQPAESKKVYTHTYITIAIISLAGTIILALFSSPLCHLISKSPNAKELYLTALMIPFLDVLMVIPYGYYRITRQPAKFAGTRFILIILAVLLNVIFVIFFHWGAFGVVLAQAIANLCGAAYFSPQIIKNFYLFFDKKLFRELLKFALPTVPGAFSAIILQVSDRPIITWLADARQAGIYSINYKLGIPMMMMVSVFEYAWKPFYLSHHKDKDAKQLFARILTYFTLACAIVFLVTSFYIQFVVKIQFIGGKLINPDYWSGMSIIPLILGGYFFNGLYTNFTAGVFIEKKTKYMLYSNGTGALINLGLNLLLIPVIGYRGAAIATIVAYMFSAAMMFYFSRKIYPINYEWNRLFSVISMTVLIYFFIEQFTPKSNLLVALIIRTLTLILFVLILRIFGFFTKGELVTVKKMLRSRNNNKSLPPEDKTN